MSLKKILFIISNLESGGVSKSMTSLLNVIDKKRYDISLMIISPTGAFMELLPPDLRLITNPIWTMLTSRISGCINLMKAGYPHLAFLNLVRLGISTFSRAKAAQLIARLMPAIEEEFDTVVDFNGQHQLYFMINKIKAKKKVTFFHSDYSKWPYYYSADKIYYNYVNNIFTISESCADSLKRFFPREANKIGVMENISSLDLIQRLSKYPVSDMNLELPSLITIGHVCENKGILWAIEALKILCQNGIHVNWYFIGSIDKPELYSKLINNAGINQYIHFLGIKTNPYPYIRKATIVVHPSKFEGKSVALDEAKILCKPIVVTNFSTVNDQFTNRHNASICDMNSISLADAITELLNDSALRQVYSDNLLSERHDNTSEIEKLYKLFDE